MVTQNNVSEKCQFLQLYIKHDININIKMKINNTNKTKSLRMIIEVCTL